MSKSAIAVGLLLSAVAPVAGESGFVGPETLVPGAIEILEDRSATEEHRSTALARLREAAGGAPGEDSTRDAIFALTRFLPDRSAEDRARLIPLLKSASTLYADDPRATAALRRLCRLQLDSGDALAAHFSLARLLRIPEIDIAPDLLVRAALNAAEVGDQSTAIDWAERIDHEDLLPDQRVSLEIVRLVSAASMGRSSIALAATDTLEQIDPGRLHADPVALLAAARTLRAVGRVDEAIRSYELFFNIHVDSPDRPAALLEHGRLLAGQQRPGAALRVLDLLVGQHPEAGEVELARLERIAVDPSLDLHRRAQLYRELAGAARSRNGALEACRRLLEILLAGGYPLEALSSLGWLARKTEGLGSIAAKESLLVGLEPAMQLLLSRGDDVGVAAAAAEAESIGVILPPVLQQPVAEARLRLGFAAGSGNATRARYLEAEADWREGRDQEALGKLDELLTGKPAPKQARPARVLRADIRFVSGDLEAACEDYRSAVQTAPSIWVEHQLSRHCATETEE